MNGRAGDPCAGYVHNHGYVRGMGLAMSSVKLTLWSMYFDAEDRRLLEHCAEVDKLTMSDVMRRALRRYAREELGIEPRRRRTPVGLFGASEAGVATPRD